MSWTGSIYPGIIGNQAVDLSAVPDTTARHPTGLEIDVIDSYWGPRRLVYAKAAAAFSVGHVVYPDLVSSEVVMTAMPNTANLGFPAAFALTKMAIDTYGWFVVKGRTLALSSASVAADAQIGIVAAGKLGAIANGKQLLGARVEAAATATVAKTNSQVVNGSYTIKVANSDGWFIGMPLTGTGVGSSAKITAISGDGSEITVDVVSTATGTVTVTGTNNDGTLYWNTLFVANPLMQGQIV